ncbi:MAG: hypothetical protein ACLFN5_07515 [bacterium]
MEKLVDINGNIREYSLIKSLPEKLEDATNFNDILLRLASILRAKKLGYEIKYSSPDGLDFKLRSDKKLKSEEQSREFTLACSAEKVFLRVEKIDPAILDGLQEELKILADYFHKKSGNIWLEPELNILRGEAFEAELKKEFQHWLRYEEPFALVILQIPENIAWQPVGKELKHYAKTGDIVGFINENKLAAFFPESGGKLSTLNKLVERLNEKYGDTKLEVKVYRIPEDFNNWEEIENKLV